MSSRSSGPDESGPGGASVADRAGGEISGSLLTWYGSAARDLPWRRTRDPYAILVSEVMLQQTRTETVAKYYGPFLARFPTLKALADAALDDVLKAWEGLGYYARARNLHRAARAVAGESGRLPETRIGLLALPGIGRYTAAAVASIAFDERVPVVDGNVARVLCRLFEIEGDPGTAATARRLTATAARLLPPRDPGTFNQAMMELGARVCTPISPRCAECPIAALCVARRDGRLSELPQRRRRRPPPHLDVVAGIIWDGPPLRPDGRVLIAQRSEDDMLGGLWEFPGGRVEPGETDREALVRELSEELGIDVDVVEHLIDVDHAYTHFRMTLHVYHCRHLAGAPRALDCADWHWTAVAELDRFAFSTADRTVIEVLRRAVGEEPNESSRR